MSAEAVATKTIKASGIKPVHAPTFTTCMEQLQEGYVAAVAATAGCTLEFISRDIYGLDVLIVRSRKSTEEELSIYAQLKNTTTLRPDPSKSTFRYTFKKRSYFEHLAKRRTTIKAILLVMGQIQISPSGQ